MHSFIHLFIHPSIHLIIFSSSSIHSFIYSFVYSFIHSLIHPSIHSFILHFIFMHTFIIHSGIKAILLVNHTLKEVFTESFFPLNRTHFLTARYCTRQKHPTERDSVSSFIIARGSLGNTSMFTLYSDGSPYSKLMLRKK